MTEKEREQVALFRYGLIAPLVNEQVEVKKYLQEIEAKRHDIPYYGERTIAAKTVQEWLLHYRRHGYEALKPKKRADRGQYRDGGPVRNCGIDEDRKELHIGRAGRHCRASHHCRQHNHRRTGRHHRQHPQARPGTSRISCTPCQELHAKLRRIQAAGREQIELYR